MNLGELTESPFRKYKFTYMADQKFMIEYLVDTLFIKRVKNLTDSLRSLFPLNVYSLKINLITMVFK